MPAVEAPRVLAVELAHALPEIAERCQDEEVLVVPHQDEGDQDPGELDDDPLDQTQPHVTVRVVEEDVLLVDPVAADVLERVRKVDACLARHGEFPLSPLDAAPLGRSRA